MGVYNGGRIERSADMKAGIISPAAASEVRICCDRWKDEDWNGRIYTRFAREAIGFGTVKQLLEQLEQFYDWINYPQTSVVVRSFHRPGKNQTKILGRATDREEEHMASVSREDLEKRRGDKATFVVRIQYRQNSTWQGQVTWAEENQTMPFRSALELLKLIDSTMEAESGNSWTEGREQRQ